MGELRVPNLALSVRSRSALPWRLGAWLIAALAPLLCLHLAEAQTTAPADDVAPMERQTTESDPAQLLDEDLRTNPERLAVVRWRADTEPPETQDPAILARFYWYRGRAADVVGRRMQALRDFRQAATQAQQTDIPERGPIFSTLAILESYHGSLRRSLALIEEAIRSNPETLRNRLVGYYARQALLQVRAGDGAAADEAIAHAVETFRTLDPIRNVADPAAAKRGMSRQIQIARAAVHELRGHFRTAEKLRRDVIVSLEAEKKPDIGGIGLERRWLALNLLRQTRLAEAENEARASLAAIQVGYGASSVNTVYGIETLARVLNDAGRSVEAEALIRRSIDMIAATGLIPRGNVRQLLAATLAAQGRWNEAMVEFDTLKEFYLRLDADTFEAWVRGNTTYPLALLKVGRTEEAMQRLTRMLDERRQTMGEKHYMTAEARGFLAMALAATGRMEEAAREFAAAVPNLLDRGRAVDDDSATLPVGEQRLRLITESYIELLIDARGTPLAGKLGLDLLATSFRLADAVRGRSVVRAVAAVATRAAANDAALADLVRAAQDADKEIGALNSLLANAISARGDDRDADAINQLRAQIDALRGQREKAIGEIESRFPDYARLIDPRPATIQAARAALKPGEAVIAFYTTERRTLVWAVPKAGEIGFVAAPLGRDELAKSVQKLRRALEPEATTLDGLPVFDLAEAWRLYAALLQPVEPGWRQVTSLFVVPHGALSGLPLGLLPTAPTTLPKRAAGAAPFSEYRDVPWLIRRTALTQLPSISALATLRTLPPGNAQRRAFIGFADPWFNRDQASAAMRGAAPAGAAGTTRGGTRQVALKLRSAPKTRAAYSADLAELPRLPDTAEEVTGIAAALGADPGRDLFLGPRASDAALRKVDLSSYRVVMFATHGLVPGDLKGLTQPALALSAPDVATDGGSGLLTAESILSLKLDADWVVLSACNTAAASGAGAEAVSGLGRAFFYAGTRAILVSNWPVETTSARSLTTDLFRRQAAEPSLSRAEALRRAMLALIDGPGLVETNGKPVFAYAHPLFWAPFSLVGDAGPPSAAR
jgi:CHAT domain-containing protein